MNKSRLIILFLISIVLSFLSYKFFFNKWLGYEYIPNTYIFDEHDYPFVGYSFRKTGIPTGWSVLNVYQELDKLKKNEFILGFNGINITADQQTPSIFNKNLFNYPVIKVIDVNIGKGKESIILSQPFLDHPIFGSWLFSLGIKDASSFDDFKVSDYRKISLYLSVFTGILIFIFSYILFNNYFISFLSFIIYSKVPEFILMSRFSLFENILIPLSLLVFSLVLFSKNKNTTIKKILIILAGIISGLAFLTKVSGIFIFISTIIFMYTQKSKKEDYFLYIIPIFLISFIYYFYMWYLCPDLFFKLLFDQANRGWFVPLSFFYQIIQPNFSGFPKSGYWLFGIISLFILFIKNKQKYFYLFIPFIVYLGIFLLMGGSNYPWYYLPFLPYLIIASSVSIYKLIKNPNIANLFLFYLLLFSSSFYWGYFVFHTNQNIFLIFRVSLLIFISLFTLYQSKKNYFTHFIWAIFIFLVLWQLYQWNNQGFQYIISNWGNLPIDFSFPI
jgi:hypothetical protein